MKNKWLTVVVYRGLVEINKKKLNKSRQIGKRHKHVTEDKLQMANKHENMLNLTRNSEMDGNYRSANIKRLITLVFTRFCKTYTLFYSWYKKFSEGAIWKCQLKFLMCNTFWREQFP